ncbi:hypothetical protein [Rhodococcus sp. BE178]|uniref:hypothetical protein n=1 Tax=Rhodococcus sp. BE178 TaxID=2817737 RepID=UPI003D1A6F79
MTLRTRIGAAVVAAAVVTTLAACSSDPGDAVVAQPTTQERVTMSPPLTEREARAAIEDHLSGTLAALPRQISFSLQNPFAAHAKFTGGGSVPCDEAASGPDADLTFSVTYWVIGVPESETGRYLDVFRAAWQQQGWNPLANAGDGPERRVRARTPDGYGFTVTDNGQGILTIAASSPCFPGGTRDGGSMPADITNP